MIKNICCTLRYENALEQIEWLCKAFGFEKHVVYADGDTVHHAQLKVGAGLIMIGSKRDTEYDKLVSTPNQQGGINSMTPAICVSNIEEHYSKAKRHGATILLPLTKEEHGAGYTCRDPEGYIWNFGDYDPWGDL